MGLLEKLAQYKPYTPQGVRYPRLFELVRKHFNEIQEALKKRYSWAQISQRAYEAWKESGELTYEWEFKKSLFYNYYHKVEKERRS